MKNIKIRTATLCGLIGAICSLLVTILNVFLPSINGSLKFEITAKRLYAASQRVL